MNIGRLTFMLFFVYMFVCLCLQIEPTIPNSLGITHTVDFKGMFRTVTLFFIMVYVIIIVTLNIKKEKDVK